MRATRTQLVILLFACIVFYVFGMLHLYKANQHILDRKIAIKKSNSDLIDIQKQNLVQNSINGNRKKNSTSIQSRSQQQYINKTKLSCKELRHMLETAKNSSRKFRPQIDGNRGIYFGKIKAEKNYPPIDIVIKIASLPNVFNDDPVLFRFRSAIKEVKNLLKLEELKWKGIPLLYGHCITSTEVIYAVSHITGLPLCRGMGIDLNCSLANDILNALSQSPHPGISALTFLSKAACFFEQFERDEVMMEDISGSNLFYDRETYDIYVVDADSFIFYKKALFSGTTCHKDAHCPVMHGNYWTPSSLNRKIYSSCYELNGYCDDFTCRGIDSSLLTCGIGRWLMLSLSTLIPDSSYMEYKSLLSCMIHSRPENRCTLKSVCRRLKTELQLHKSLKNNTNTTDTTSIKTIRANNLKLSK